MALTLRLERCPHHTLSDHHRNPQLILPLPIHVSLIKPSCLFVCLSVFYWILWLNSRSSAVKCLDKMSQLSVKFLSVAMQHGGKATRFLVTDLGGLGFLPGSRSGFPLEQWVLASQRKKPHWPCKESVQTFLFRTWRDFPVPLLFGDWEALSPNFSCLISLSHPPNPALTQPRSALNTDLCLRMTEIDVQFWGDDWF